MRSEKSIKSIIESCSTTSPIMVLDEINEENIDAKENTIIVFVLEKYIFIYKHTYDSYCPCPRCLFYHLAANNGDREAISEAVTPSGLSKRLAGKSRFQLTEGISRVAATTNTSSAHRIYVIDTEMKDSYEYNGATKHPNCQYHSRNSRNKKFDTERELFESFSNRKFGLIRKVESHEHTELGDFHTTISWAINPSFGISDTSSLYCHAGAGGWSEHKTKLRARMEAFERYSALYPDNSKRQTVTDTAESIPATRFYMHSKNQYQSESFPYTHESEMDNIEHVKMDRWKSAKPVKVPKDIVYISKQGGDRITDPTSNGCAAHFDEHSAIKNGLFELFERDAAMKTWYGNNKAARIGIGKTKGYIKETLGKVNDAGYKYKMFDITSHQGIPSYLFVMYSNNSKSYPRTVVATGAHIDSDKALIKAIREGIDILAFARNNDVGNISNAEEVITTEDHFKYYQQEGSPEKIFDHICSTRKRQSDYDDLQKNRLEVGISDFVQDIEIFYKNITPSAFSSSPVEIVRVASPDLIPISFGFSMERLTKHGESVANSGETVHPFP